MTNSSGGFGEILKAELKEYEEKREKAIEEAKRKAEEKEREAIAEKIKNLSFDATVEYVLSLEKEIKSLQKFVMCDPVTGACYPNVDLLLPPTM